VEGVENGKIVFVGGTSYSLVLTLLVYIAMHSITDGQTDRQHYHNNSRSCCVAVRPAQKAV